MIDLDIGNFMTWFVSQCVSIFGSVYNILDSITFLGTSLLKFSITILIISATVSVLFTLVHAYSVMPDTSDKVSSKKSKKKEDKKED